MTPLFPFPFPTAAADTDNHPHLVTKESLLKDIDIDIPTVSYSDFDASFCFNNGDQRPAFGNSMGVGNGSGSGVGDGDAPTDSPFIVNSTLTHTNIPFKKRLTSRNSIKTVFPNPYTNARSTSEDTYSSQPPPSPSDRVTKKSLEKEPEIDIIHTDCPTPKKLKNHREVVKKERNRLAAQRCRERKNEHIKKLEALVKELREENSGLLRELGRG